MGRAGWVVVLEAQPNSGKGAVEVSRLRRLLEHMPGVEPIALHSAERVAVQVHVDGTLLGTALPAVLRRRRAASARGGADDHGQGN